MPDRMAANTWGEMGKEADTAALPAQVLGRQTQLRAVAEGLRATVLSLLSRVACFQASVTLCREGGHRPLWVRAPQHSMSALTSAGSSAHSVIP